MTEADACAVLQVHPDEAGYVPEDALKAAYRRCGGVAGARVHGGFRGAAVLLMMLEGHACIEHSIWQSLMPGSVTREIGTIR